MDHSQCSSGHLFGHFPGGVFPLRFVGDCLSVVGQTIVEVIVLLLGDGTGGKCLVNLFADFAKMLGQLFHGHAHLDLKLNVQTVFVHQGSKPLGRFRNSVLGELSGQFRCLQFGSVRGVGVQQHKRSIARIFIALGEGVKAPRIH